MISDADRITHMLDAIAKMRISLEGMSKAEFMASDDKKAVASSRLRSRCRRAKPSERRLRDAIGLAHNLQIVGQPDRCVRFRRRAVAVFGIICRVAMRPQGESDAHR